MQVASSLDPNPEQVVDWLAAVLRGDQPYWNFDASCDVAQILKAANDHGIVATLHQCLEQSPNAALPAGLREALGAAARIKAAQSLLREHQCRSILKNLHQADLPVLLLKGSALGYWAYPSAALRECADIDLLLRSREDVNRALPILAELGYPLRDKISPGDLVSFEATCVGERAQSHGLEIDLHWRLSSTPVFAFRFDWNELLASSLPLPRLAPEARGLGPVHAYLHACMHRVQNMAMGLDDVLKWQFDLHVLGRQFRPEDWQELVSLSALRGLSGTCLSGMRAAEQRFGRHAAEFVLPALSEAERQESMDVDRMDGWFYIQTMCWRALPSNRARFRWLKQRLFPNRAYLRMRHGDDGSQAGRILKRMRAAIRRLVRN
jgi:hypothetical protein